MSRILLAIVALAACVSGFAATPVSVTVGDSAVILQGEGGIANVKHFEARSPARLVVDLYGTRMSAPLRDVPLSNGLVRLRMGAHADKTRFVFDAGGNGLPSYTVKQDAGRRVVVRWQTASGAAKRPAVTPTRPAARAPQASVAAIQIATDPAAADGSASPGGGPGHRVRIAVQPSDGLRKVKRFVLRDPDRLVIDLYGVRVGRHARRFALDGGFRRLRVGDAPDKTRLVFDVDGARWPDFEVDEDRQDGSVVVGWPAAAGALPLVPIPDTAKEVPALPRPPDPPLASVPPAVEEQRETAPPRSHSEPRTTLVDDDVEIAQVLARIAEVSGRPIVVDDAVGGRIMLRLVDVPWDQALEMVAGIAGLRVDEDGEALRVGAAVPGSVGTQWSGRSSFSGRSDAGDMAPDVASDQSDGAPAGRGPRISAASPPEPDRSPGEARRRTAAPGADLAQTPRPARDVAAMVRAWAAAWSRQDLDRYLAHYSPLFRPESGLDREAWAAQRRIRVAQPAFIEVQVSNLRIEPMTSDRATVRFDQAYRASHYRDRVVKTLEVRREAGDWKIVREVSE